MAGEQYMTMDVRPWSAVDPDQVVTYFRSARVQHTLYDGWACSFSMPAWSPAARNTSGLETDVTVHRAGVPWQRFRVQPVPQSWDGDGSSDISITALSYKRLLGNRFIQDPAPTFTATDQGAIVWGLIDHTQSQPFGDLGITEGSTITGVLRDRNEYAEGDNIGKRLAELEDVIDGVWYDIDVDRVLTCKLGDDFPTRPDALVLGVNIEGLSRTPSSVFGNVAGASGSKLQTVPAWATSPDLAFDPRGRWEVFDSSHGSTTEQTTVQQHADGLLDERMSPPATWKWTIAASKYFTTTMVETGEFCELAVPTSIVDERQYPAVSAIVQVTEVNVSWDENGAVQIACAGVEVDQ